MQTLLNHVIEAHGGMARWNQFSTLSAHLSQGGIIWPLKGKGGMLDEVDIKIQLHRPWTSHSPFGAFGRRTAVSPEHVAIENDTGLVEQTSAPRASFAGHQLDTPWSDLQLAYFVGYAIWNYFTMPFTLARPGFTLVELSPWQEDGQTLRRHDYEVDISGGAPAVHYLSGHVTVQGITVPTVHKIYVRDADGGHQPEPLVVSIDVSAIQFA